MATRAAVQTPGEAPADQASAAPAASVEQLQAALAAQQAQMAQMMATMQQLMANQRTVPAEAAAQSLPSMTDVDVDEVNKGSVPVLTKDGWIVPPQFSADPVKLAEDEAKRQERKALMTLAESVAAKA
jgi:hypothetical protein